MFTKQNRPKGDFVLWLFYVSLLKECTQDKEKKMSIGDITVQLNEDAVRRIGLIFGDDVSTKEGAEDFSIWPW